MHKGGFFRWYIGSGLKEMFAIWGRFIIFIPRFFSFKLLLRTLFVPWHRDVSLKNWRGIRPLRSAERFLWSFFSRFVGAIVRLFVVCSGIVIWPLVIFGGAVGMILYIGAPAIAIIGFVLLFTQYTFFAGVLLTVISILMIFVYRIYHISGHMPYKQMSMAQLSRQKWFSHILERIGVTSGDIDLAIFEDLNTLEKFLTEQDLTVEEFEMIIAWETEKQIEREHKARFFTPNKFLRMRPIGLSWHFGYTVHLDRYAQDLSRFDNSQYAHALFHGFDQEIELLTVVLSRPYENNAMIVGKVGTGRHMLAHEIARRIRTGYYDGTFLQYMRILQCDFTSVIAQAKSMGDDPETVIHNLFHEAAFAGNVILVVDHFEQYMEDVNTRGFSFASIIDQYASLATFRMIGIATDVNFHEHVEQNSILMRHYDVITIDEMNDHEAMKVLFMRFYGAEYVPFTFQALRQVIVNAERYTNTASLPTRAIDLASEVMTVWQGSKEKFITADMIDDFVRAKTGVPVGDIASDESQKLLSLEDEFHKNIIAQDYAVKTVAAALRRMRSGMSQPHKPAGSFLFLGPTGVGKTEMAKTVAAQYFGSQEKVIRLDMSEFQGESALDRLIGSKELKQQGVLVTAAREHPYALLLLDEIEKANPRVLDLFLQVLDEGYLHDAFGRKVSFTTMIIIATSNAGALAIKKMIENGVSDEEMKRNVIDTIITSGAFRPELLNRFDDVALFHPLDHDQITTVARMMLVRFGERMEQDHHVSVFFDEKVAEKIVADGYDPIFGARSLLRYIDDAVSDAFAKKIIAGNVHRGETVRFGVSDMDV
jgi:ATP-dependent Clp protease ATP-binding subunit ClpA